MFCSWSCLPPIHKSLRYAVKPCQAGYTPYLHVLEQGSIHETDGSTNTMDLLLLVNEPMDNFSSCTMYVHFSVPIFFRLWPFENIALVLCARWSSFTGLHAALGDNVFVVCAMRHRFVVRRTKRIPAFFGSSENRPECAPD